MPDLKPVVIDTNILFSSLLTTHSRFSEIIINSGYSFYICESVIIELFKHKERIIKLSRLDETEVVRLFYKLLRIVNVSKEVLIDSIIRQKAYELCKDIDPADTPHVALTLHLKRLLWTGDEKLKKGISQKEFFDFFDIETIGI
ncbi:PIN domain-containing protein [Desulfobacterales bacterium HSG17]|nr:PIN domain-containing protein [Desulfobacterales bacterium HSG17]